LKESEKDTEKYLCSEVERRMQGIAYKFNSPQRRNVPDRLCILPKGRHFFVEVKSEGKQPTKGQVREMVRLQNMGHPAWVVRTKREVDHCLTRIAEVILEQDTGVYLPT